MSFFRKSGIVNVKMVITEEKILSNIDKIQKLINPNSKKQIVQLDEDTYFKDLVGSIKNYVVEYPRKSKFPDDVYRAIYNLVEFATSQFEENTKKIEELIRKREKNIKKANALRSILKLIQKQPDKYNIIIKKARKKFQKDIILALNDIYKYEKEDEEYQDAMKIVKAKINNLESNTFIEIDIERIEDRSKALSYIGLEISEELKDFPVPEKVLEEINSKNQNSDIDDELIDDFANEEIEVNQSSSQIIREVIEENENQELINNIMAPPEKVGFWQKIKNCKLVRAIVYVSKIRIRIELPALPEGRG